MAVIGSAMSAVYAGKVATAMAATGLPAQAAAAAEGSLAGALAVARQVGGDVGAGITKAASDAYVAGLHRSVVIGAGAVFAGALFALLFLPSRAPSAAHVTVITSGLGVSETASDDPDDSFPVGLTA